MQIKHAVMVGLALLGVAFAQGERLLEPMAIPNVPSGIRAEWYVGTNKPRFMSWFTQNTYAVMNEPVTFEFSYFGGSTAKAIRFTPTSGGSSLRVNLGAKNMVLGQAGGSYLGILSGVRFAVNASDFGVNTGAKTYRVVLVDADEREGEPIELTLNFRSRTDYKPDPTLLRTQETLSGVVPIGYFQAQQGGSVFVPSVQNFNSYSRLWFEIRLPPNFDLYWNTLSFTTAVRTGIVTLSDDVGQRYEVAWDDRAVTPLPDSNGFRFALIMTPKLLSNAKRLTLVQAPVKAENVPPGLRLEDTMEPFRSGLTLNLPLQR